MRAYRKTRCRFRVKAGLSALFFSVFFLLYDPQLALPTLLAASVHECGHLLFARFLRIPLSELSLDLLGARLALSSGLISYKAEFFLAAGGPLFSFLLAEMLEIPLLLQAELLYSTREASLFLGALNLLPVRGFDGSRMLTAILSTLASPQLADTVERLFTGGFLILLWGISVYLLLVSGAGLPLFVFSIGLFIKIFLA